MRFFMIFLCFFVLSLNGAAPNTKDKIADNKKNIQSNEELEKRLNKKLEDLASDILKGQDEVKDTTYKIDNLKIQVSELEEHARLANVELNKLTTQNSGLIKEQIKIEENMLKIITQNFAYDLIVPKNYIESEESIIANEVLHLLTKNSQSEINELAKDYSKTINQIKTQTGKIDAIKFDLKEFKNKQERLIALQNKQTKDLEKLKKDKESYQKQLADLQAQQNELRATLEKLSILAKNEEEQKRRKEEEKARAEQIAKEQKAAKEQVASKEDSSQKSPAKQAATNVRQVGSSYQNSSVRRYTGAKTIAPLDSFSLKQAFGDYTDPIYKIKIFNESVVLRSKTTDATVKNVLDGKVVFAKETPVLKKVIIVENEGGMHTIYAQLSKIAPTIKVGSKIKKGYVIGRVERDLTFEVTQKNYHINPMELIASK